MYGKRTEMSKHIACKLMYACYKRMEASNRIRFNNFEANNVVRIEETSFNNLWDKLIKSLSPTETNLK